MWQGDWWGILGGRFRVHEGRELQDPSALGILPGSRVKRDDIFFGYPLKSGLSWKKGGLIFEYVIE